MTTEVDSDKLRTIHSVVKRIDAQSRILAKKLHELGHIYALYGALDGLSLSYSMIKYSFDVLLTNSDAFPSDVMNDWMRTSTGILTTAATSTTLIIFSMLANHFDEEDKNLFKSCITTLWYHCRNTMKGLKNAYKGARSTFQTIELLGGQDLRHLIVPVGLLLGGLLVINRIWFRHMMNQRKEMMKANSELLADIQNAEKLTHTHFTTWLTTPIQNQLMFIRGMALLSAAYGGFVDGLYWYVGVLGLCALESPILIAMTACCAIYVVACIATRIYEEYDFQRKLVISQTKIDLALCGRRMELLFTELHTLADQIAFDPENKNLLEYQPKLIEDIKKSIALFEKKRKILHSLSSLSYTSAFLAGMRNGLAAYGALTTAMFAVTTILIFSAVAFPPALLITCIILGMAGMLGFIAHSMIETHRHCMIQKCEPTKPQDMSALVLTLTLKETKNEVGNLKPEQIKTTILESMDVGSSSDFFQEGLKRFEVLRSFFSGMGKGIRTADNTLNHDIPILFMILIALLHALVLALRALSIGFGRPTISAPPVSSVIKLDLTSPVDVGNSDSEPDAPNPKRTKWLYSFFSNKEISGKQTSRKQSETKIILESLLPPDQTQRPLTLSHSNRVPDFAKPSSITLGLM